MVPERKQHPQHDGDPQNRQRTGFPVREPGLQRDAGFSVGVFAEVLRGGFLIYYFDDSEIVDFFELKFEIPIFIKILPFIRQDIQ